MIQRILCVRCTSRFWISEFRKQFCLFAFTVHIIPLRKKNRDSFGKGKKNVIPSNAIHQIIEIFREARSVLTLLHNEHTLREYAQTIVAKFPPDLVSQIISRSSGSFSAASSITPSSEGLVANKKYLVCFFVYPIFLHILFKNFKKRGKVQDTWKYMYTYLQLRYIHYIPCLCFPFLK